MTGALITLSSSTMAKRWLTLARVISAKRRAPIELKVKFTTHSPVSGLVPARASVRSPPSTSTRLRTAIFSFGLSCIGRNSSPGGGGPPAVGVGRLVHQLEGHVRGLAEQLLDPVRIADAGKLHDDAVCRPAG